MAATASSSSSFIKSHTLMARFFTKHTINRLIHMFDNKMIDDNHIIRFIEDERIRRGIHDPTITFYSSAHGYHANNGSSLLLGVRQNGIDLFHFTIHISVKTLPDTASGMVHFYKNIYTPQSTRKLRRTLYTRISLNIPNEKPKSLKFTVENGYHTPSIFSNIDKYDTIIHREMNVILYVLNRILNRFNIICRNNAKKPKCLNF